MSDADNDTFNQFIELCRDAVRQQVSGSTNAFHVLWSQADDVVLMGAAGNHQVGWTDVDSHLSWAADRLHYTDWSVENLLTLVSGDLAVTVDLEHMSRVDDNGIDARTLRATQVYRLEDGRWRVAVRHGDPMEEEPTLPSAAKSVLRKGVVADG